MKEIVNAPNCLKIVKLFANVPFKNALASPAGYLQSNVDSLDFTSRSAAV